MIYSDPVYRFSILDFWWEHEVAVIKQYKHSTRKEYVSMHLNVSSISGEASDIAGPFDQHQRHQIRVSKILSLERDTQGLYSVYISNLDPTWRTLLEHLHLKGTILIFEIGLELRWVESFFFFSFSLFCAFYYFYVLGNWVNILYFYKWKLDTEKNENAIICHWKSCTFYYNLLKRLHWHSYWCKTKGW